MSDFIEVNADLHVHGLYSGAVSKKMIPKIIGEQAPLKGLQLVGTGDILNEKWIKLVKEQLKPINDSISEHENRTKFILQTEVEDNKRVHHIILFPSFSKVYELREKLKKYCKDLDTEGRPKIWLNGEQIAELCIESECLIGPSHAFTPWTAIFKEYNSIKECYGKYSDKIYFLELGLSADTNMADRISELHRLTFLSNSDAHCVHPDTRILTANGSFTKIRDSKTIETLLSNDLNSTLETKTAIGIKVRRPAPNTMYKIKTRINSIITTPEHRFFVLEDGNIKEKFASELMPSDLVANIRRLNFKGKPYKLPRIKQTKYYKLNSKGLNLLRKIRKEKNLTQNHVGKLIGLNEKDSLNRIEYGKTLCKDVYLRRLSKLYKIPLESMKQFIASETHTLKIPQYTNTKLCQILGYLLGDGGRDFGKKTRAFSITDKDLNNIKLYSDLISKFFKAKGYIKKKKGNSYRIRYFAHLLDVIEKIAPNIFIKSKKRRVPGFIFTLLNNQIAGFIRGFFDAEGTVGNHSVELCSSSLELIREIQSLLLRFGISSQVYENLLEKTKQKYRHKLFLYGQENIVNFERLIGFGSVRKSKRLKKYIKSLKQKPKDSFVDYLPLKKLIRKIMFKSNISVSKLPRNLQYHYKTNKSSLRHRNVQEFIRLFEDILSKEEKAKVSEELQRLKTFSNSDITWEAIRKIEIINGSCNFVYDFTVPVYENYIANNFIVHNSPWPNKMGREFNKFKIKEVSFDEISKALKREGNRKCILNVGLNPKEGKYHKTRCIGCLTFFDLKTATATNWRCPNCGKPIKKGVYERIEELADLKEPIHPNHRPKYIHIIPLSEIIAIALGIKQVWSGNVQEMWKTFVNKFDNEINVLIDTPIEELTAVHEKTAELVKLFREDKFQYIPGGAGVYGVPIPPGKKIDINIYKHRQKSLSDFKTCL